MVAKLMNVDEVAGKLGVCRATVFNLSRKPESGFPKQIKLGRAARWIESELDVWLDNNAPRGAYGESAQS
jgi:predicted DNA-binding transcriptional regulator AlpA